MKKMFVVSMVLVLMISVLSVGLGIAPSTVVAAPCAADPPPAPGSPTPANLSSSISIYTDLNWSVCANTSYYHVYFDTNSSPVILVANTSNNYYNDLPALSPNTVYYWQVIAFNTSICNTSGPVWSFTTCVAPSTPGTAVPSNTSSGVSVNMDLSWGPCDNASSYDVYFDTNPSPSTLIGSPTDSAQVLTTLNYSTTYYWKVVAKGCGGSTNGSIWNFTTEPAPPTPTPTICPTPSAPSSPIPFNGSTDVYVGADLSWNASTGATSYQVYFGTNPSALTLNGSTANNSWALSTLDVCTTYYWKVVALNSCGSNNSSSIWRFTTMSAAPTEPVIVSPTNTSTNVNVSTAIDWFDSLYASSYEVYFGTNASAPVQQGTSLVSYWSLVDLSPSTTYYWKVIAKNNCGLTTSSATFTFSTAGCVMPDTPSTPSPGNLSTNVSVDADLDWANCSYATYYNVYFGTNASSLPLISSPTVSNKALDRLSANTTYYWQIKALNACNISNGSVWSFTTECANVSKPQLTAPINGSTNASANVSLSWSAVANASLYDVYLSTSATPVYNGSTTNTSYQPSQLNYSTTYYWKVVAKNNCGNNSSDVWNFTTGAVPVVTPTPTSTTVSTPTTTAVASVGGTNVTLNISSGGVLQQAVNVTSADGKIKLTMPSGTTARDSAGHAISVINMSVAADHPDPVGDRIVIAAFNFSPSGATFSPAITIVLNYGSYIIPQGVNESTLVITFYNESSHAWEYITNGVVNTAANTITFTVNHFTTFAIQSPPVQHGGGGLSTWVIIVMVFVAAIVLGLIAGLYIKYRRMYGAMTYEEDEVDLYDQYGNSGQEQGEDEDFRF